MSKNLSAAAAAQFDSEVKHAYQSMGFKLKDTVTVRTGVVGDTYNFRKMGKGMANQKPSQADVTPMDVSHSKIPCTLGNWNAPEYTDIFDDAEVNFEERNELAETIASAMGRRADQLIIDALEAATLTTTDIATSVGGADTNLNVDKLRRASSALSDLGVPMSDRHFLCSASNIESMLGQTEVTSSDYNNVKALVSGDVDTFMGFKFHMIETRDEGGLPLAAGDVRMCFAYHKSAVGYAEGIAQKTEVNYVPQKTSWLSNGILKAGAVVRDVDGAVGVLCDET